MVLEDLGHNFADILLYFLGKYSQRNPKKELLLNVTAGKIYLQSVTFLLCPPPPFNLYFLKQKWVLIQEKMKRKKDKKLTISVHDYCVVAMTGKKMGNKQQSLTSTFSAQLKRKLSEKCLYIRTMTNQKMEQNKTFSLFSLTPYIFS